MKKYYTTLLFILCAFTAFSQTTILSYTPSGSSGNWRKESFGQSFTVPATIDKISGITVKLSGYNPDLSDINATFHLYQGDLNVVGGAITNSKAFPSYSVTLVPGDNSISFPATITVTPGQQFTYYITFVRKDPTITSAAYVFVQNNLTPSLAYGGGISYHREKPSSAWTSASDYDDLFKVFYDATMTLPTSFLSFYGDQENLYWSTTNEYKGSSYTIEKSLDGQSFEIYDEVEANSNNKYLTQYELTHNQNETYAFYRIKINYPSEKESEYSKVIRINLNGDEIQSKIYPNPTTDWLTVESNTAIDNIKIIDKVGKVVYENSFFQQNELKLSLEKFNSGAYIIEIKQSDKISRKRLIKQ